VLGTPVREISFLVCSINAGRTIPHSLGLVEALTHLVAFAVDIDG